ncbi:hypothetical protein ACFL5Z_02300 [Planctomycetota bacterium]
MDITYRGTREVSALIKVKPGTIIRAIWDGRLHPPEKGPGSAFLWTEDDINRASKVLVGRPYKSENAIQCKEIGTNEESSDIALPGATKESENVT